MPNRSFACSFYHKLYYSSIITWLYQFIIQFGSMSWNQIIPPNHFRHWISSKETTIVKKNPLFNAFPSVKFHKSDHKKYTKFIIQRVIRLCQQGQCLSSTPPINSPYVGPVKRVRGSLWNQKVSLNFYKLLNWYCRTENENIWRVK